MLHLPRLDGVIEGRVVLEGSKDVGEADVGIWYQDGSNFRIAARVDAGGRFRVDRLDPAKRYALQVLVLSGGLAWVGAVSDVEPGNPVQLVPRIPLSLTGRVDGHDDGEAVVAVMATKDGISQFADFNAADGTFSFDRLVEGEYVVTLLGRGLVHLNSVGGVRAGSRDTVITRKR